MLKLILCRNLYLLSGQEISDFIFVIDQGAFINGVYKNPADTPWIPLVSVLGSIPIPVQCETDGAAAQSQVVIQGKDLSDDPCLLRVDGESKIIDSVIAI
jgi:hypothetical protein